MHSVGLLATAQGSHAEAAVCFLTALDGRRQVLGADANDTLRSAVARGQSLTELEQVAEAEDVLADAEARATRVLYM